MTAAMFKSVLLVMFITKYRNLNQYQHGVFHLSIQFTKYFNF